MYSQWPPRSTLDARAEAVFTVPNPAPRFLPKQLVETHDLLAPVYNWFTEGFDTKDLKEAKALLEELAA